MDAGAEPIGAVVGQARAVLAGLERRDAAGRVELRHLRGREHPDPHVGLEGADARVGGQPHPVFGLERVIVSVEERLDDLGASELSAREEAHAHLLAAHAERSPRLAEAIERAAPEDPDVAGRRLGAGARIRQAAGPVVPQRGGGGRRGVAAERERLALREPALTARGLVGHLARGAVDGGARFGPSDGHRAVLDARGAVTGVDREALLVVGVHKDAPGVERHDLERRGDLGAGVEQQPRAGVVHKARATGGGDRHGCAGLDARLFADRLLMTLPREGDGAAHGGDGADGRGDGRRGRPAAGQHGGDDAEAAHEGGADEGAVCTGLVHLTDLR